MAAEYSRRLVLAGMATTLGGAAFARAPLESLRPVERGGAPSGAAPRLQKLVAPSEVLVQRANLGGQVGFAVADATTGEVLEARLGDTPLPPASTMKAITAIYGLEHLGSNFTFKTDLLATGPIVDGVLDGDLVWSVVVIPRWIRTAWRTWPF